MSVAYPAGNILTTAYDLLDRPVAMDWSHAAMHAGAADWEQTYIANRPLTRTVLGQVTRDFRDPQFLVNNFWVAMNKTGS